uniref:Uncharacterized protein n=1 Tax=Nelumbo nucifera TaxID=4432 RepID=A0A822XUJ9_NELNU|nr:TPA_asm: hypothetical protein HUJ06_026768 [Nelumbo nucifera]
MPKFTPFQVRSSLEFIRPSIMSSVPLQLHPLQPPLILSHGLQNPPKLKFTLFQVRKFSSLSLKGFLVFASSLSLNPSNWDREEIRCLREEQRWLRQEQ